MFRTAAAIALALGLAGCVSLESEPASIAFTVRSSATADFRPTARHVVVVTDSAQKAQPDSAELVLETRRMLEAAGFSVVGEGQPPAASDLRVSVAYDVSAPEFSSYTTSTPVYGETGIASSRTVRRVNGRGDKVSETTYTPRVEVVGYDEAVHPLVKFTHTFSLVARKASGNEPVWSVRVSRTSTTGDRDSYPAYMLRAAQSYIGHGGDAVEVAVAVEDPGVVAIIGGPAAASPGAVVGAAK